MNSMQIGKNDYVFLLILLDTESVFFFFLAIKGQIFFVVEHLVHP